MFSFSYWLEWWQISTMQTGSLQSISNVSHSLAWSCLASLATPKSRWKAFMSFFTTILFLTLFYVKFFIFFLEFNFFFAWIILKSFLDFLNFWRRCFLENKVNLAIWLLRAEHFNKISIVWEWLFIWLKLY